MVGGAAITEEIIPGFKFSRASYLAGKVSNLAVRVVPPCGWSGLQQRRGLGALPTTGGLCHPRVEFFEVYSRPDTELSFASLQGCCGRR